MNLPLDGVRVIDMSSVVMGPLATQLMGDLGADVIVIEDRRGDTNRSMGAGPHPDLSGVSLNLMRNKRSVGLDVRTEAGYDVLGRLVAGADVFVTNLRPGSRRRARITYGDLIRFRSDLVYCAAAGYPADDADADLPAYDDVIQARMGVVDLMERVGLPPALAPTIFADKACGLAIANLISAALFRRERTGEGSDLSVAMTEIMRSFLLVEHGAEAIPEPPCGPAGYQRVLNPNRRPQPTADGRIHMLPYDREHYEALFDAAGRDELRGDERIATRRSRITHGAALYALVAEILATRPTQEWLELGRRAGIPTTQVGTLEDLIAELPMADHPHAGRYRVTPPLTGERADAAVVRRPAPLRGEHNGEVLGELGYSSTEIAALESNGVLFTT